MTTQTEPATAELIAEARGWLLDCFPGDEDEIADCSDREIVRAVKRYYDGGWDAFLLANS